MAASVALIPLAFAAIALACVLAAAACDLRRFEIPDELSIAILALFVCYALSTPSPVSWLGAVGGVAMIFAVGLALFWLGWMGGGDVKLFTAIAAWTGTSGLPQLLVATAAAGGVLAVTLLAARAMPVPATLRMPLLTKNGPIPYGVAIAAGTVYWAWQRWPAF